MYLALFQHKCSWGTSMYCKWYFLLNNLPFYWCGVFYLVMDKKGCFSLYTTVSKTAVNCHDNILNDIIFKHLQFSLVITSTSKFSSLSLCQTVNLTELRACRETAGSWVLYWHEWVVPLTFDARSWMCPEREGGVEEKGDWGMNLVGVALPLLLLSGSGSDFRSLPISPFSGQHHVSGFPLPCLFAILFLPWSSKSVFPPPSCGFQVLCLHDGRVKRCDLFSSSSLRTGHGGPSSFPSSSSFFLPACLFLLMIVSFISWSC